MTAENCTVFADFIFLGLSGRQDVQQGLFVLFLLVYGITAVANVGMVLLIKRDPRLHTPMYYSTKRKVLSKSMNLDLPH